MGQRMWMIPVVGIFVTVAIFWFLHSADETWRGQDFNVMATHLIGAELPASERASLTARTLRAPSGTQDRFVCVQPASTGAGEVYEVQFRKGAFGITTNEIYTPSYRSAQTRSIVKDDCLSSPVN